MGSKMTIVVLRKQTGFNRDFKLKCFGRKYQVFLFHQDSVIFSNRTNSKQEKIRIPCRPLVQSTSSFFKKVGSIVGMYP